ncbi:MAG: site-2 protease family protein, partial [Kiritimatiellae bacterium]|nr:site-2 protease family protein [Kiritimatiellia bacterium]
KSSILAMAAICATFSPDMASSTKIGTVLGIPIRVHITLWIFLPLIASHISSVLGFTSLFWGLLGAIGLFTSVALHELGHSYVAIRKGCSVREILLVPFGGIAKMQHLPSRPRDEALIAAAGPAVSLMLALVFHLLSRFIGAAGLYALAVTIYVLSAINLMLALFNLLPSFPMDGGRIFRAWMTPKLGRLEATRRAAKIGQTIAIVFGVWAVFGGRFNLSLLAIAIFIYMAAGSEYRAVQLQESFKYRPFGVWGGGVPREPEGNVIVGPAPYEQTSSASSPRNDDDDLFDELWRRWR